MVFRSFWCSDSLEPTCPNSLNLWQLTFSLCKGYSISDRACLPNPALRITCLWEPKLAVQRPGSPAGSGRVQRFVLLLSIALAIFLSCFESRVDSAPPWEMGRRNGEVSSSTLDIEQIDESLPYDPPIFPIAPARCIDSYFQYNSGVGAKDNQAWKRCSRTLVETRFQRFGFEPVSHQGWQLLKSCRLFNHIQTNLPTAMPHAATELVIIGKLSLYPLSRHGIEKVSVYPWRIFKIFLHDTSDYTAFSQITPWSSFLD